MTKHRSREEDSPHRDNKHQRWIATVTVGYPPAGKRIVNK